MRVCSMPARPDGPIATIVPCFRLRRWAGSPVPERQPPRSLLNQLLSCRHPAPSRVVVLLVTMVLALAALPATIAAQEAGDVGGQLGGQFATWEQTARAAAGLLERDETPVDILEQLRERLAAQREVMLELSRSESVEARTIRAQLDALGPAPGQGESEPTELTERRAALNRSLAASLVPTRAAREAYERANVLIAELDTTIRRINTRALMARFPSPLNPAAWRETGTELRAYFNALGADLQRSLSDPERTARFQSSLPLLAVLTVAGLVAIFLGERWATRRALRASAAAQTPTGRRVMSLVGFFARFVLPVLGALALLLVPRVAQIEADSASTLRAALPPIVLFLVGAHVLGRAIFSHPLPGVPGFQAGSLASRPAYALAIGLGLFLSTEFALEAIQEDFRFSARVVAVLLAPILLAGAVLLFVFGSVLVGLVRRRATMGEATEVEDTGTGGWVLVARLLQVAAALSAVFLLLGYYNLAREALVPVTLSLALLGFALWVFELTDGLFVDLMSGPETAGAEKTLLPILLAVLIGVAALPPLALIWGARPSDIAEVWRLVTDGVPIGETRVSLSVVLILIIAFTLGLVATRWVQRLLSTTVLPRTRLDAGARTAMVTGIGYLGLTLSGLIAISTAGIDLSSLAFVAGALSVGIGFGLQNIVQNFVSGIILLVERPIKEGDWIEVSGHTGFVRKISVRSTRIETFDRHDVIVPNGDLVTGTVKNMTLSSQTGRISVKVGVAYGSDLEATKAVLARAAERHAGVLAYPAPQVLFMGLGDSSLDFELRCYLRNIGDTPVARSDLTYEIYTELGKAGVGIPFPQRDLHIRDYVRLDPALQPASSTETP